MKIIENIKNVFQNWSKNGIPVPFAHNPVKDSPSVTLLFFYFGFILSFCIILVSSIMLIIKGDYLSATLMPTLLMFSGFIFYRLRRLDSIKIDLDDKSINMEGGSD